MLRPDMGAMLSVLKYSAAGRTAVFKIEYFSMPPAWIPETKKDLTFSAECVTIKLEVIPCKILLFAALSVAFMLILAKYISLSALPRVQGIPL